MSIETTYICDRCEAREICLDVPLGWMRWMNVTVGAEGLPSYSPIAVKETLGHVCGPCAVFISDAVRAALVKGAYPPQGQER